MIVNNGKASKKQAKKTIPRKVPIPSEIFISPHKIVEMACREEAKFVKMMKECDIKDFSRFVGYEADITLISGKKPSTLGWNPLVFALVLGKQDLSNFILRQTHFNITRLLQFEIQQEY